MRFIKYYSLLLICLGAAALLHAQPVEQFVKIIVAPDHPDWTYKTGEPVKFSVTVLKDGNPVKNAVIKYEVGPEKSTR